MRGHATYRRALAVTAVILLGAVLFAFLRSRGQVGAPVQTRPQQDPAATQLSPTDWRTLGQDTYRRRCQACHAAQGRGRPGLAPSLVPLTREIYESEGGSDYLIRFLLWGLDGEVVIESESYQDHPPFQHLSDTEHSALLNLLVYDWPDEARQPLSAPPFNPGQITVRRRSRITPAEVRQSRPNLRLGDQR